MPEDEGAPRERLSRERVLRAAVALADAEGIEAVSMRRLAQDLDVVPMALYKHVADKEGLLDGMVDLVVAEIEAVGGGSGWRAAARGRILAARRALLRHPWASRVIESRSRPSPVVLGHIESLIAIFRAGGFSPALTHQLMHTLGSRMWGFTQELFPTPPPAGPDEAQARLAELAAAYPGIAEIALAGTHDGGSIVGPGCDDQYEFEFALELLLDGFERLRRTRA